MTTVTTAFVEQLQVGLACRQVRVTIREDLNCAIEISADGRRVLIDSEEFDKHCGEPVAEGDTIVRKGGDLFEFITQRFKELKP